MVSRMVVLNFKDGLNTAAVSNIINFLKSFESTITMRHNGRIANCKSLISLINLGAEPFSEVEVSAEGPNEANEITSFIEFLQNMADTN